jgi:hypothetical protein
MGIGWTVAVLVLAWHCFAMLKHARKFQHLENYAAYLLLSDEIRDDHKRKFLEWIRTAKAGTASELGLAATNTLTNMAGRLGAAGSTASVVTMIWQAKEQQQSQG